MKITDYVQSLNLKLSIYFGANQSGPWIAIIEGVEYKKSTDDPFLTSCSGRGDSPNMAIAGLCRNLSEHKYIVIRSLGTERVILPLPKLEPNPDAEVMKVKRDENYPSLGFDIKIGMSENETGYFWTAEVHVIGPDDLVKFTSKNFESKKDCMFDLLANAMCQVQNMIADFK